MTKSRASRVDIRKRAKDQSLVLRFCITRTAIRPKKPVSAPMMSQMKKLRPRALAARPVMTANASHRKINTGRSSQGSWAGYGTFPDSAAGCQVFRLHAQVGSAAA